MLPRPGRKGNQVRSLNDPVTVSGSEVLTGPIAMGEKGRWSDQSDTASQETCFLIHGELPMKADPEYSREETSIRQACTFAQPVYGAWTDGCTYPAETAGRLTVGWTCSEPCCRFFCYYGKCF